MIHIYIYRNVATVDENVLKRWEMKVVGIDKNSCKIVSDKLDVSRFAAIYLLFVSWWCGLNSNSMTRYL